MNTRRKEKNEGIDNLKDLEILTGKLKNLEMDDEVKKLIERIIKRRINLEYVQQ
ncbi:MAG: hypothetical protein MJ057_09430 [Sphaerochaetaceae bacterium]|nr:hypothetical protein [Sphaerochaetaceae bacterium]